MCKCGKYGTACCSSLNNMQGIKIEQETQQEVEFQYKSVSAINQYRFWPVFSNTISMHYMIFCTYKQHSNMLTDRSWTVLYV